MYPLSFFRFFQSFSIALTHGSLYRAYTPIQGFTAVLSCQVYDALECPISVDRHLTSLASWRGTSFNDSCTALGCIGLYSSMVISFSWRIVEAWPNVVASMTLMVRALRGVRASCDLYLVNESLKTSSVKGQFHDRYSNDLVTPISYHYRSLADIGNH